MKLSFQIFCITLFSLFLISSFAFAEEATPAETMVGISQLMTSTDQYPDNIIVHGFVSKVFPQDNLINLIDHPEVKTSHQSAAKQCPTKTAMNSVKGCPMAAASAAEKICPVTGNKTTTQSCPKNAAEKCDKACTKPCTASSAAECTKTCPKASGKECSKKCTKTCPKSIAQNDDQNTGKTCPMAAAKPSYGSAGNIPTLPVQWNGDMPETATFVQVTGEITQKDGEMLFVAESVQLMSN